MSDCQGTWAPSCRCLRRVGAARAKQMLMLPNTDHRRRKLSTSASSTPLVEPGRALDSARRRCPATRGGARRGAYGVIKALLGRRRRLSTHSSCSSARPLQSALFGSDDFAEGIAAFREKRRPVFGAGKGARR